MARRRGRSAPVVGQASIDGASPPAAGQTSEPDAAATRKSAQRRLVATGGVAVVRAALKSGKRVVAAGPGNPPVVVDETADIPKAAKCVFEGASFDNNILCVGEKAVVCTQAATRPFMDEMRKLPVYELSASEVAVERPLREAGALGDLRHRGLVEAVLAVELEGRLPEAAACVGLPAAHGSDSSDGSD